MQKYVGKPDGNVEIGIWLHYQKNLSEKDYRVSPDNDRSVALRRDKVVKV